MLKPLSNLVIALALVTSTHVATAQIVDVQPLLSSDSDNDGFTGEVSGALELNTGNVDLVLAHTSLLMAFELGAHTLISSTNAEVGSKDGDTFSEKIFTHLRHQVSIVDWFTWETYTQVATDRFKRMNLRALVGAGPRFSFVEGPAVSLAVAASYMFEREMLNKSEFDDSEAVYNNHRLSAYITGKFKLAPLLSVVHTTYYQPLFEAPQDFRLSSESNLVVNVTETLGLSVGFLLTYDHKPPTDVDALDTGTTAEITYAF